MKTTNPNNPNLNVPSPLKPKTKKGNAFTLIEMLIAIAIIGTIVTLAVPALFNSKEDTYQKSAEARAKVLNEARDRAIITGITSDEAWTTSFGTSADSTNAIVFLLTNNLIRYNVPVE